MKIDRGLDKGRLDVSDMPRFEAPAHRFSDANAPTIIDFGLLAIYTLTAFAGAFAVFLKYGVRQERI